MSPAPSADVRQHASRRNRGKQQIGHPQPLRFYEQRRELPNTYQSDSQAAQAVTTNIKRGTSLVEIAKTPEETSPDNFRDKICQQLKYYLKSKVA